jgi:GTP-binding protein
MRVLGADFVTSATSPENWPPGDLPEIAFAGRSNVGKSSMLNKLSGRRALARVSNTPGRTRLLNFFDVTLDRAATREVIRFCDLPGYGFAKVSRDERAGWSKMIETYLSTRDPLKAVVTIIDAVVGPTEDDLQLLAWLREAGRQPIATATKLDRIVKAKRIGRLRQLEKELGVPRVVGFSSEEGIGKDELWGRLLEAVHG